jgi:hypothetical protein
VRWQPAPPCFLERDYEEPPARASGGLCSFRRRVFDQRGRDLPQFFLRSLLLAKRLGEQIYNVGSAEFFRKGDGRQITAIS